MPPRAPLALSALLALALAQCKPATQPSAPALPAAPVAAPDVDPARVRALAAAINQFGLALFAQRPPMANTLLSPYDLARALLLVERGSDGVTRAELSRVLHLEPGQDLTQALPSLQRALERSAQRPGFALASAARVWPGANFTVLPDYQRDALRLWGAPVVSLDYARDPEAQRRTINGWVSEQTHAKIPELLPPGAVTGQTTLVLTSAVYFLGRWATVFEPGETRDEPFFLGDGRAKQVPTMHGQVQGHFVQDGNARLFELPYEGDELAMDLVIPVPGARLSEVLPRVSAQALEAWAIAASPMSLRVVLPKVSLRQSSGLREPLEALGAQSLFAQPDLRRLTAGEAPTVSQVLHEVYLDLNERGTEAAAATAVTVLGHGGGTPPASFVLNQPFVFALRHRPTSLVLFVGHVADPAPSLPAEPTPGGPFAADAVDPLQPRGGTPMSLRGARFPRMRILPLTGHGALDPLLARRVLLRNLGVFRMCHERAASQNPLAIGRVTLHFTITRAGTVRDAHADGDYPVRTAMACMQTAVSRLAFPIESRGETALDFTMVFVPTE
ncbi:MAG: serpin family protein [Deltaproteobacteria bacterium]|nr:serpin family protein [Deltaproteobacteria bacterium]